MGSDGSFVGSIILHFLAMVEDDTHFFIGQMNGISTVMSCQTSYAQGTFTVSIIDNDETCKINIEDRLSFIVQEFFRFFPFGAFLGLFAWMSYNCTVSAYFVISWIGETADGSILVLPVSANFRP